MLQSFDNYFHLYPDAGEEGAGFVMLTNYSDDAAGAELAFALGDLLLGLPASRPEDRVVLLPPLDSAPDRDRWPAYEGTYLSARQGRLATVRVRRGRLQLVQRRTVATLIPTADAYFYEQEGGSRVPVAFLHPPAQSEATHLFIGGNSYERVTLDSTFQPDPSSWSHFTGEYRDPSNLGEGAVWRLSLRRGRLHLSGDWADEICTPLAPHTFLSDIGLLQVDPDGATLQVGRATRYFKTAGNGARAAAQMPEFADYAPPPRAALPS
jgi:hypothetical protein